MIILGFRSKLYFTHNFCEVHSPKKRKLNSKIPKVNKRENLLEVSYDLRFFRIQSERIQRIVKVKRLFEIWNYKVRKLKMQ